MTSLCRLSKKLSFSGLREQLKAKFRLKKQSDQADDFGQQLPLNNRAVDKNKFGSFFGRSQASIAPRILQETHSMCKAQQINVAKDLSLSSLKNKSSPVSASTKASTQAHNQSKKDANDQAISKAKTLKAMRDYSLLLSDDADFPDPVRSMNPNNQPSSLVSGGHEKKKPTPKHPQVGSMKPDSAELRKKITTACINVHKDLPTKLSSQVRSVCSKPSAEIESSHHKSECRKTIRIDGSRNEHKALPPRVSSRVTSSGKPIAKFKVSHHRDHPKKRAVGLYTDEDDEAFEMLRKIIRYHPDKYKGVSDRDDRTMEVGFSDILKEERRSSKIAKEEDAEELRLIEEEEERERRMRKKQKISGHR